MPEVKLTTDTPELPAVARAREMYCLGSNDDIEIDDKPKVSVADHGTWVQAWVWVQDEEYQ